MTIYDAILVCLAIVGGYAGYRIGAWSVYRRLKDLALDLAAVEDRLLREAKRRGALERWEREEAKEAPTPAEAANELRNLIVGHDDGGFIRGKEGGVYRGPRAQ